MNFIQQRREAMTRSAELLAEHCNPWQLYCVTKFNILPVADSQGTCWVVNPYSRIQNARNLDSGTWYCLTAKDGLIPTGDTVLAIKILLERDVDEFYAQALELDGGPTLHPLADLLYFYLFEGVGPWPSFNEQNCCVEGNTTDGWCDYHQGLHRGMEAMWYAANHLYADNVEHNYISYHIKDMYDANKGMQDKKESLYNIFHGGVTERTICESDEETQQIMVDVTERFLTEHQQKKEAAHGST